MNESRASAHEATLRETAARWTVRRDRGLSAAESIEYELWLAADERHAAAIRRAAEAWVLLDRIPEAVAIPVLSASMRRRAFWRRVTVFGLVSAAAAIAVVGVLHRHQSTDSPLPSAGAVAVAAGPREFTLSDGTIVQLNTGGEVIEQFTATERRVLLARGEAHFSVTKNPARPFIVHAGTLQVRAVGTAFNVNLRASQIEVLVTEGRVQLATDESVSPSDPLNSPPDKPFPLVEAGQLAVVPVGLTAGSPAISVTAIDAAEISSELAWQAPLLRLGGATLAELVLEFQRRSGQRVVLADPALAQLRIGGRFRADDAAGFASLMATTLDLEVENAADGTLVLRKKNPESR